MALLKCYECGRDVSSDAQSCPNCGAPTKRIRKDNTPKKISSLSLFIIAIAVVATIYAVVLINGKMNSAYIIAMKSNDVIQVGRAIRSIDNPDKLYKIAVRCEREADYIIPRQGDQDAYGRKMAWISYELLALERIDELKNKMK